MPVEPDAKNAHLYDDVEIAEPDTFNDDHRTRSRCEGATMTIDRHLKPRDLRLSRHQSDEQEAAKWRLGVDMRWNHVNGHKQKLTGDALKKWNTRIHQDYLRCIASVDDKCRRLLDFLDRSA